MIEVPEYYWRSHKSGNIKMYISPSGKEGCCLLFGPPLLPVLPNIFHVKQVHWANRLKYFYVAVLIENNQPELKLDLSKIYFTSSYLYLPFEFG